MQTRGLSGAALKGIALLTMLIDHFAAVFYAGSLYAGRRIFSYSVYLTLRILGRLAFPIYAFLLVEGCRHTRSAPKYLLRLLLFGLVSELPFDFALRRAWVDWSYQNVYFTLFLGLAAILLWDLVTKRSPGTCGLPRLLLALGCLAAMAYAAKLARTDYGLWGVLTIEAFYLFGHSEWQRDLFSGCALLGSSPLEAFGFADYVLFHFYNGRRGRQPKYLFYVFYPLHLIALGLLCRAIY